jgi:hypothetical protein
VEASPQYFRVAQDRMVRGQGQFLDDVKLPGMVTAQAHQGVNHSLVQNR